MAGHHVRIVRSAIDVAEQVIGPETALIRIEIDIILDHHGIALDRDPGQGHIVTSEVYQVAAPEAVIDAEEAFLGIAKRAEVQAGIRD